MHVAVVFMMATLEVRMNKSSKKSLLKIQEFELTIGNGMKEELYHLPFAETLLRHGTIYEELHFLHLHNDMTAEYHLTSDDCR